MVSLSQNVSDRGVLKSSRNNALALGNKAGFEPMLESMQSLAENLLDTSSQRAAFIFLGRCVSVWGQLAPAQPQLNGNRMDQSHGLPGFERFVYERLVPAAFGVLSSPQFNLKDPQMVAVSANGTLVALLFCSLFLLLDCS